MLFIACGLILRFLLSSVSSQVSPSLYQWQGQKTRHVRNRSEDHRFILVGTLCLFFFFNAKIMCVSLLHQHEIKRNIYKSSLLLQTCCKNMAVKIKKRAIQDGAIAFIIQSHKCLIPLSFRSCLFSYKFLQIVVLLFS